MKLGCVHRVPKCQRSETVQSTAAYTVQANETHIRMKQNSRSRLVGSKHRALSRLAIRLAWSMVGVFIALTYSSPAFAYAWMIRHGYTGCVTCHSDPSGAGLLTPYGRAQSDLLLRTQYGSDKPEEAAATSGTAWGLISPPDWLLLGGQFRTLNMFLKPQGQNWTRSMVLMQADLAAEVRIGGFRANGSIGVLQSSASRASLFGNVVSREHWVGYAFDDDAFLLRAGRINLPFGLRIIEHTMFVRQNTRTDINDTQQHGVAFAYSGQLIRGEFMGILGNYQLSPDAYRERGYSGYVEISPASRVAVGLSSLVTHAQKDYVFQTADTRQAHGVFTRLAPWPALVLMAEADLVVHGLNGAPNMVGYASLLEADVEPIQGVHFIGAAESAKQRAGEGQSWALWGGVGWFFLPHVDVRFDAMRRSDVAGTDRFNSTALLAQLHVFL